MGRRVTPLLLFCLSSMSAVLGSTEQADRDDLAAQSALRLDDQCAGAEDEGECTLNAVQLRGQKVSVQNGVAVAVSEEADQSEGDPIWHYALNCWRPCGGAGSCPSYCGPGNACCKSGDQSVPECQGVSFYPVIGFHTCVQRPAASYPSYGKVWSAEGMSFFDNWNFEWEDVNHGAAEYLLYPEAKSAGVVEEYDNHAILRAGKASPKYQWKRQSAKITTKKTWKYFLMAMKFTHVPYGCGVWPALFTLAPGAAWPAGGEVDILEYVNDGPSQSSFHTGEQCTLNQKATNVYGYEKDYNRMDYNCYTHYPKLLGCAPNKWVRSGQAWANSPGVVAMEWTEDALKLFFIPEGSIPADLNSDAPRPDQWEQWLFSYYPFKESGCSADVMQAQQIIMQIGFCGDWASKVWGDSGSCKGVVQGCRSVDPLAEYAPEQDCCTKYIFDEGGQHGTDAYLEDRAFFNISYMKIYQQNNVQAQGKSAGAGDVDDLAPKSPDGLEWWYTDYAGKAQGPYANAVMKGWAASGYFKDDTPIRDTPTGDFTPLRTLFPSPEAPFSAYPKSAVEPA